MLKEFTALLLLYLAFTMWNAQEEALDANAIQLNAQIDAHNQAIDEQVDDVDDLLVEAPPKPEQTTKLLTNYVNANDPNVTEEMWNATDPAYQEWGAG